MSVWRRIADWWRANPSDMKVKVTEGVTRRPRTISWHERSSYNRWYAADEKGVIVASIENTGDKYRTKLLWSNSKADFISLEHAKNAVEKALNATVVPTADKGE